MPGGAGATEDGPTADSVVSWQLLTKSKLPIVNNRKSAFLDRPTLVFFMELIYGELFGIIIG
jgi:hypothetical protein